MQSKFFLFFFLLLQQMFTQAQQKKANGYLIYTLGKDTTLIGHYTLKGNDFSMTVLTRPTVSVHKLTGILFDNGEMKKVEGYNYKPVVGKDSQLIQSYKLYYQNDTTFIEQQRGAVASKQYYAIKGMVVNSLGIHPYIFFPALLVNYAPHKIGDSIISNHIVLGRTEKFVMKRVDKTTITVYSNVMGKFTLFLDKKGYLTTVDAIGSSWNVKGTVLPYLNMDSLIIVNAKREQQFGPIGSMLKPDSVQTTIGIASVKINYTRPSVRGRIIFGKVVPWGRFWRTGANAATKIKIDQPLYFDGKELPAGEYSIFTMPAQKEWTMMINKQANIWGTDYNPDFDVLRVPMKIEHLPDLLEMMTIEVVPINSEEGVINLLWENTKASVRFSNRK